MGTSVAIHLGGALASRFAKQNAERCERLMLLTANPLLDAKKQALLLAGLEDKVLSKEMGSFRRDGIEGGVHAGFTHKDVQADVGRALIDKLINKNHPKGNH